MKAIAKALAIFITLFSLTPSFSFKKEALMPAPHQLEATKKTTLKVGYVDIDYFYVTNGRTGNNNEYVNVVGGYAYNILNELGSYNNWDFNYVPGSWDEQIENLANDQIDLLLAVNYSEERGEKFSFAKSTSILNDYADICVSSANTNCYYDDVNSFRNLKKFGMIEGNLQNDYFFSYAKENSIDTTDKVAYYKDNASLSNAFDKGEVDALIAGGLFYNSSIKVVKEIAAFPAYIAAKDDSLASKVDEALALLSTEKPYFINNLYATYYGRFDIKKGFSKEEADFIALNRNNTFKITGHNDFAPFESYDEKTSSYIGAYNDILSLLKMESGLNIAYENTPDLATSWNSIKTGQVSLISAVYVNGNILNEYNVLSTSSFYDEENSLLIKKEKAINPYTSLKIGILEGFIGTQAYINEFLPDWDIQTYSSYEELIKGLKEDEVDGVVINTVIMNHKKILANNASFALVPNFQISVPVCCGVYSLLGSSPLLQKIISKSINNISAESISNIIISNTTSIQSPLTGQEIFQSNIPLFITLIVLTVVLLMALAAFITFSITQAKSKKSLASKNQELQKALLLAEEANKSRDEVDKMFNKAQCGIIQLSCPLKNNGSKKMSGLNANQNASSITGIDIDRLVYKDLKDIAKGSQYSSSLTKIIDVSYGLKLKDGTKTLSLNENIKGSLKTFDCIANCIAEYKDNNEKIIQLTFFDVTEHSEVEKELLAKSETDPLTTLLNKTTVEALQADFIKAKLKTPCALFMIDVDKFKSINDTFGHLTGDEVLKDFSSFLKSVAPKDSLLGRVGGDEFSLLIKDARDKEEIKKIAEGISKAGHNKKPPYTCSVGIVYINNKLDSYEKAYSQSDAALYQSKNKGLGKYTINEYKPDSSIKSVKDKVA